MINALGCKVSSTTDITPSVCSERTRIVTSKGPGRALLVGGTIMGWFTPTDSKQRWDGAGESTSRLSWGLMGGEKAVRKQYHFWPGESGMDAWDVDRLLRLAKDLPVQKVPLA